jgi:hypothetical protein
VVASLTVRIDSAARPPTGIYVVGGVRVAECSDTIIKDGPRTMVEANATLYALAVSRLTAFASYS